MASGRGARKRVGVRWGRGPRGLVLGWGFLRAELKMPRKGAAVVRGALEGGDTRMQSNTVGLVRFGGLVVEKGWFLSVTDTAGSAPVDGERTLTIAPQKRRSAPKNVTSCSLRIIGGDGARRRAALRRRAGGRPRGALRPPARRRQGGPAPPRPRGCTRDRRVPGNVRAFATGVGAEEWGSSWA